MTLSGDYLSLRNIDSVIAYDYPAEPLSARQELLMTLIRSLLDDGLLVVGDIVGGTDAKVEAWNVTIEDALAPLNERVRRPLRRPGSMGVDHMVCPHWGGRFAAETRR
jgi:hypothetical protein